MIEWADGSYTHMEVKVGGESLSKTLETAVKIEQRFAGNNLKRSDVVLLLPTQLDAWASDCIRRPAMQRVHALTWIDVACALRTALTDRTGESIHWRVWAHAFCGAVEQDLLGMRSGLDPQEWARSLPFLRLRLATRLLSPTGMSHAR